ncbi:MAG TPA: hypothetical protein VLH79_05735 [Chthonomonadales bacterium]|nr:hypothetical protein [Chthonomonadales bacterium]
MRLAPGDGPIVQCAVNVSEGRRQDVLLELVAAAGAYDGAVLTDWSADPDHHRAVLSLLGAPGPVEDAVLAVATVAARRIDLRVHEGVHPRLGALDVVPFSPVRGVTVRECVEVSLRVADRIAGGLGIPVHLYELSSPIGPTVTLPQIRRQYARAAVDPSVRPPHPDFARGKAEPATGVCVVGARAPLVAYNIEVTGEDDRLARAVAAAIRVLRGTMADLAGVMALGLWLPMRRVAQVSMNLTRPLLTPLPAVFDAVARLAEQHGGAATCSEVVGLIPEAALGGQSPERVAWVGFRPDQVLERWLGPVGATGESDMA